MNYNRLHDQVKKQDKQTFFKTRFFGICMLSLILILQVTFMSMVYLFVKKIPFDKLNNLDSLDINNILDKINDITSFINQAKKCVDKLGICNGVTSF